MSNCKRAFLIFMAILMLLLSVPILLLLLGQPLRNLNVLASYKDYFGKTSTEIKEIDEYGYYRWYADGREHFSTQYTNSYLFSGKILDPDSVCTAVAVLTRVSLSTREDMYKTLGRTGRYIVDEETGLPCYRYNVWGAEILVFWDEKTDEPDQSKPLLVRDKSAESFNGELRADSNPNRPDTQARANQPELWGSIDVWCNVFGKTDKDLGVKIEEQEEDMALFTLFAKDEQQGYIYGFDSEFRRCNSIALDLKTAFGLDLTEAQETQPIWDMEEIKTRFGMYLEWNNTPYGATYDLSFKDIEVLIVSNELGQVFADSQVVISLLRH